MWWHSTNYLKQDGPTKGMLAHRRYSLYETPRLMLRCRLFGHKPVVDGHGPIGEALSAARWVVCDRCGVRPDPQGSLDPERYAIGEPYTGRLDNVVFITEFRESGGHRRPPGPWPVKPTGDMHAEVVVGQTWGVFSAELKVGNCGSDNKIGAHLRMWPIGAIYLGFGSHGTWLQRRLNPDGYESRVISLNVGEWRIGWKLWARRDAWSAGEPRWMQGFISLDLAQKLFGPKRYSYKPVEGPTYQWVRLNHGELHQVQLKLHKQRLGRPRLEWRAKYSWTVEWKADAPIPVGDGKTLSNGWVDVPEVSVENGMWDLTAAARAAHQINERRDRSDYRRQA
ncbi:hypothetical protein ACIBH1_45210 [Nonomuraea sp. NPDC050663]|uniref:hypothetical protein n=1 Tax=Nonomuraea sp. NPDC050663 TaxID=3364370 RepID=UPI0037888660